LGRNVTTERAACDRVYSASGQQRGDKKVEMTSDTAGLDAVFGISVERCMEGFVIKIAARNSG
jgi:hypothetical protein